MRGFNEITWPGAQYLLIEENHVGFLLTALFLNPSLHSCSSSPLRTSTVMKTQFHPHPQRWLYWPKPNQTKAKQSAVTRTHLFVFFFSCRHWRWAHFSFFSCPCLKQHNSASQTAALRSPAASHCLSCAPLLGRGSAVRSVCTSDPPTLRFHR